MQKLIFVCTGNTCRSPMAEKLAMKIAKDKNIDITILSRGISVAFEARANVKAVKALEKYNIDLNNHKAKVFEAGECTKDTIVLTMTSRHKEYLHNLYPNIKAQIFSVTEYAGLEGDIVDPYGESEKVYEECANELEKVITKIL